MTLKYQFSHGIAHPKLVIKYHLGRQQTCKLRCAVTGGGGGSALHQICHQKTQQILQATTVHCTSSRKATCTEKVAKQTIKVIHSFTHRDTFPFEVV